MIHVIWSIVGINLVIGAPVILFTEMQVYCEINSFHGGSILVEFVGSSHPRINKKGNKVTFLFVEKKGIYEITSPPIVKLKQSTKTAMKFNDSTVYVLITFWGFEIQNQQNLQSFLIEF